MNLSLEGSSFSVQWTTLLEHFAMTDILNALVGLDFTIPATLCQSRWSGRCVASECWEVGVKALTSASH